MASLPFIALCIIALLSNSIYARELGYFWHLTDVHTDALYKVGANADCGLPLCCRDVTENQTVTAGQFGSFLCDIPPSTVELSMQFLLTEQKPDFVLMTGDLLPHIIWNETRDGNLQEISYVLNLLEKNLPNVPIIPVLGNHEAYPVDELDFPPNCNWLTEPVADMWGRWIPADAVESAKYAGYFSVTPFPGLRVISINTQWSDPLNFYLVANPTWSQQFDWLDQQLAEAAQAGQQAYIIGHIPIGIIDRSVKPLATMYANQRFNEIIQKYSSIVKGSFFGHTHNDHFRVFYDATGTTPLHTMYISPSLTPYTDLNPTMRLFSFDKQTMEIVDMTTYYLDLKKANEDGNAVWQKEYSPLEDYGMPDLSPASWDNFLNSLWHNETAWDKFTHHYTSSFYTQEQSGSLCQGECRQMQICALGHTTYDSFLKCIASPH